MMKDWQTVYSVKGPKTMMEMTATELMEAMKETKTIILSFGAIENHGVHLPLGADYYQADLQEGDVIVLTTDGLHGEIGSGGIREELDKHNTMKETCDHLVQRANERGGHDNITVICIKITEGDLDE